MEAYSAFWRWIAAAVLATAAIVFFALNTENARAQDVGPSGCVMYCGSSSSGSSARPLSEYGGFWRRLERAQEQREAELKRKQAQIRYDNMMAENKRCLALYSQSDWFGAEAACEAALANCDHQENCAVIRRNLAGIREKADEKRRELQTIETAKRRVEESRDGMGKLVDTLTHSDPNVVDLTFLQPNQTIVLKPSKVKGRKRVAGAINMKTELLLDAIEKGKGDWRKSLAFLEDWLAGNPRDVAARDAYAYLKGMYRGYLARAEWANLYYKRGIWSWMNGYYDLAVSDLAEAVASNPDDIGARQLHTFILGHRNASGYCDDGLCVHLIEDLPADFEPAKLDYMDDPRTVALRERVRRDPKGLQGRALLHFIDGLAVYAKFETGTPAEIDRATRRRLMEGVDRLGKNDFKAAARIFSEVYAKVPDDNGILFAVYYAQGLESGWQSRRGADANMPWDPRMLKTMNELLRDSLVGQMFGRFFGKDEDRSEQEYVNSQLGRQELAYIAEFMRDPFVVGMER